MNKPTLQKLLNGMNTMMDLFIRENILRIVLGVAGSQEERKMVQKHKRVQLFENEDVVLEQRGNRYYLSLYDKEGKFQREVTIDVKDDYKVGLGNGK